MSATATSPPSNPVHTAGSIAALIGGRLDGPTDLAVTGLAALDQALPGSLSFIRTGKFASEWARSKAGAALVTKGLEVPGHDPALRALIFVDNVDVSMARLLAMFAPPVHQPPIGAHPTAIVDPAATIGKGVRIGPGCLVGPGTRIGDGCVLHASVTLGAEVVIGPGTIIFPQVTIYDRCSIGAQCILHGGVVIGADGFGYVPDPQGRGLIKLPHIGTVEIGHQVEIGANSCVDRGKFGPTIVGDGTKIDNLVQIGHNVRIGRACIVCGMTAIGGSATLEDGVVLAGQVGVQDGRRIGTRAVISAMSGVMSDVPPGETWFGSPAGPHKDQMRALVALRTLSTHLREFRRRDAGSSIPAPAEPEAQS